MLQKRHSIGCSTIRSIYFESELCHLHTQYGCVLHELITELNVNVAKKVPKWVRMVVKIKTMENFEMSIGNE